MFADIDLNSLNDFLNYVFKAKQELFTKNDIPSRLGMSLFMSAFEDLMSMKTRAFLVKDIDPTILQRLLGTRSLATELSEKELNEYYLNKAHIFQMILMDC